jgi:type IV secretion system protein TrbC
MRLNSLSLIALAGIALLTFVMPSDAYAAAAGAGGALPWEGPLATLRTSMSGPVAGFLSIIAIVVAGATLVFGGEVSDFAKRLSYVVLVIGVLALANTAYTALFPGAAATIGTPPATAALAVGR